MGGDGDRAPGSDGGMNLPLDVLHRSPAEAVRRIALQCLDEARGGCDRLRDPADEEALHDFRVAIRRLRSTARAWRKEFRGTLRKKHERTLRDLQQATGAGRDAEVALAWLAGEAGDLRPAHRVGHKWLMEHLGERLDASMEHARDRVREAFDRAEGELRERLSVMTIELRLDGTPAGPTFAEALAAKARAHVADLVARLQAISGYEDAEASHAARIRCKRLRYLVEPVVLFVSEARAVLKGCKKLQDVLGDLNDTHVLRDEVGQAVQITAVQQAQRLDAFLRQGNDAGRVREQRRRERSGLLEMARRLQGRRDLLFGRLSADWLADGAASLVEATRRFAARLESLAVADEEIERKFLLTGPPEIPAHADVLEFEQGYLATKVLEERLRAERGDGDVRYVRTFKLGQGVRRLEMSEEISAKLFEKLWPLTEGRRVRKRRHVVAEGEVVWEIDEFLDRDLWLAEIELSDAAQEVVLPAWLAPVVSADVTTSGDYSNRKLAM